VSAINATLLGIILLLVVIYYDLKSKGKNRVDEGKVIDVKENKIEEKSSPNPVYLQLLNIPIWAIYFLVLSTVGLTIVILAKIWFPEFFDEEFFWRIFYSYLTLMVSTVVISKMAEAIRFVKKQD